ncbi:MAG TPA: murein biosynthesis integral membrane protein MurJ [Streptosporangiaceae bacterium]|nr:murein biosynthesis integral membrane protein MurJ [Streptosporangiaceae bacterium]
MTDTQERSSSLLRSGAVMAVGTIASRLTGFLRTAMLTVAFGTHALGDVYNTANTVPNIVYDLLLGGILTSVIVPLIVRARERDRAYGEQYEQRLFSIAVIFLAALTVIAVLLAPVLIGIYAHSYTGAKRDLAILFAEFFLPQIFFYGIGAFAGAILNTRNRFAAPMWAPVLNNVVVIAIAGVFLGIATGVTPDNITFTEKLLLALGTTAGIVLQTLALWPSLRAVGFRWRPRFDFRKGELSGIGRMAGWTLVYVIATQIGFAVTTALANAAGDRVPGHGFTAYFTAYQLFQLPYAIVAVSVITALLPRMSQHASEGAGDLVKDDFSSGLRLSSVIMIPAVALMVALGVDVTVLLFGHGATSIADATIMGHVVQMFALGLLPFSAYQLMLRVFYAYRDTKTTAFVAFCTVGVNVAVSFTLYNTLPAEWIVVGLATGFVVAQFVGVILCWSILRLRLGGLDGKRIIGTHLKLIIAAVPTGLVAYAIHLAVNRWLGAGMLGALLALVAGSAIGGVLYLVTAKLLRVSEVETMVSTLTKRLLPRAG